MFRLYDGRNSLWQWDLNQKLIVEDATIKEVHFCNRTEECALICETYVADGIALVNIPNILLQYNWRIHIYAYDGNATRHEAILDVKQRSKPADYVYTEIEMKTWEELEAQTGYYIPTVDTSGNLTWQASKETLPAVPGTNIKGEPGRDGADYVLTEADKGEIADLVLAALPNGEGVSY